MEIEVIEVEIIGLADQTLIAQDATAWQSHLKGQLLSAFIQLCGVHGQQPSPA